jgi:hypothetical protein
MEPVNSEGKNSLQSIGPDIESKISGPSPERVEEKLHVVDPLLSDPRINGITKYATATLQAAKEMFFTSRVKDAKEGGSVKSVTLVLMTRGGFGDILFIHKAAQALLSAGCKVSIAVLPGQDRPAASTQHILKELNAGNDILIVTSQDPSSKTLNPDCVIIGPTKLDEGNIPDHFRSLVGKPSQLVYEYGVVTPKVSRATELLNFPVSAGVGPGQIGIFIEDGLINPLTLAEKQEKLGSLCQEFAEPMSLILQEQTPEQYLESTHLYFGYAHLNSSMERFVSTVAFSEKDGASKCIDIVLPWRVKNQPGKEFSQKCTFNLKELQEAGIGKLEIVSSAGVISHKISGEEGGKVLRIINPFPLANKAMQGLLAVSEDLTLATGDQSWNEGILHIEKVILYEQMQWKTEFYQSTKELSAPYPLVGSVMKNWTNRNSPQEVAQAVSALALDSKESGADSQVRAYHRAIVNEDNRLEQSLAKEVDLLSTLAKDPELKAEYDKMEETIIKAFYLPNLIDKFSGIFMSTFCVYNNTTPATEKKKSIQEFLPTLDNFKALWMEADTSLLPEEILTSVKQILVFLDRMNAEEVFTRQETGDTLRLVAGSKHKLLSVAQRNLQALA